MARRIIGALWDRGNRNAINSNFEELYNNYDMTEDLNKRAEEILVLAENRANSVLKVAEQTNAENKNVQNQIDNLILSDGESDAEVINARGDFDLLRNRLEFLDDLRGDYNFNANAPVPPKIGLTENSFKLVRKISSTQLEVFQKTNKGYLRYVYQKDIGGNGSGDYGENHESLRLVKVEPIADIIVFKRVDNPKSGSVSKTFDFPADEVYMNSSISPMFDIYKQDRSKLFHPTGNNTAFEPYEVQSGASVTYDLDQPYAAKNTVTFFYRRNGSGLANHNVEIKVNGYFAKEVTLTMAFEQASLTVEIPTFDRSTTGYNTLEVTIENKADYSIHLLGFNVSTLSENKGQEVDNFIGVGSKMPPFIDNHGASDYAMKNAETGKNFGSYHGGEVSTRCDIMWREDYYEEYSYKDFGDISVGQFCVLENFSIKKIGILIGRAYMHTNESFNIDGTVHMTHSYQVMDGRDPIPFIDFWTCLTCTSAAFNLLRQPVYMNLRTESDGHHFYESTDGYVIQETGNNAQELHSRFTRFNNEYSGASQPSSISKQNQYNKHYYAPIRNNTTKTIAPKVLQFSKALDFFVY